MALQAERLGGPALVAAAPLLAEVVLARAHGAARQAVREVVVALRRRQHASAPQAALRLLACRHALCFCAWLNARGCALGTRRSAAAQPAHLPNGGVFVDGHHLEAAAVVCRHLNWVSSQHAAPAHLVLHGARVRIHLRVNGRLRAPRKRNDRAARVSVAGSRAATCRAPTAGAATCARGPRICAPRCRRAYRGAGSTARAA